MQPWQQTRSHFRHSYTFLFFIFKSYAHILFTISLVQAPEQEQQHFDRSYIFTMLWPLCRQFYMQNLQQYSFLLNQLKSLQAMQRQFQKLRLFEYSDKQCPIFIFYFSSQFIFKPSMFDFYPFILDVSAFVFAVLFDFLIKTKKYLLSQPITSILSALNPSKDFSTLVQNYSLRMFLLQATFNIFKFLSNRYLRVAMAQNICYSGTSVCWNFNQREDTCFKFVRDEITQEISQMGFHDKFNINFYKLSIEYIVLNSKLDSLLLILLLEKFKYSYFIGLFSKEMHKFDSNLPMKLFLYSRYNVSQFLGSSHLTYFSYFIKLLFIISVHFFAYIFAIFQVNIVCYYGSIRLFYQAIARCLRFLPQSLSISSITQLNVTSDPVKSIYKDYNQAPQNALNRYLQPPTSSACLKLAQIFFIFRNGQSEPTPTPLNPQYYIKSLFAYTYESQYIVAREHG